MQGQYATSTGPTRILVLPWWNCSRKYTRSKRFTYVRNIHNACGQHRQCIISASSMYVSKYVRNTYVAMYTATYMAQISRVVRGSLTESVKASRHPRTRMSKTIIQEVNAQEMVPGNIHLSGIQGDSGSSILYIYRIMPFSGSPNVNMLPVSIQEDKI